jgi:hypothetical protein
LKEVSAEENGGPMDDFVPKSIRKLPPDTNKNYAYGAAMEICSRVTASIGVSNKKDPDDGRVAADEVTAEKTRFHGSNEKSDEPMQESLSKLPPDSTENIANDEHARQKLDSSSENGSKQLDKFDSTKVKKKVPDEPEEPPREESIAV